VDVICVSSFADCATYIVSFWEALCNLGDYYVEMLFELTVQIYLALLKLLVVKVR
jgi:hypothetical protein